MCFELNFQWQFCSVSLFLLLFRLATALRLYPVICTLPAPTKQSAESFFGIKLNAMVVVASTQLQQYQRPFFVSLLRPLRLGFLYSVVFRLASFTLARIYLRVYSSNSQQAHKFDKRNHDVQNRCTFLLPVQCTHISPSLQLLSIPTNDIAISVRRRDFELQSHRAFVHSLALSSCLSVENSYVYTFV